MSPASPDVEVFVTVEPVATVAIVIDAPTVNVVASNVGLPGQPGSPGPPGLEWVGDWDALNHYMPNYAVTSDGSSFVALEEIFGDPGNPLPINDPRWLMFAQGGSQIITGTNTPDNTVGQDGWFYIDTTAGILYGPRSSGAWPVALIGTAP